MTTKHVFGVLLGAAIIAIIAMSVGKRQEHAVAPSTTPDSILGCYQATIGKDVYTLHITALQGTRVQGSVAFTNYEKDSSSGTFDGTYDGKILLGNYTFDAEGMRSVRELAFQKTATGFVEGFGPVTVIDGREAFVDRSLISYDEGIEFDSHPCGPEQQTSQEVGDAIFTGKITSFDTGCFADAICSVTIDGKTVVIAAGMRTVQVPVGSLVGVPSIGDLETKIGHKATVFAKRQGPYEYTLYGNKDYYVKVQ